MEKTNIEISSTKINLVVKSFALAVIAIYLFNHTGKFNKQYNNLQSDGSRALNNYSYITPETTVTLTYKSPFGTEVVYPTKFKTEDTWSAEKGINAYSVKAECYVSALIKDFMYVIIFTLLIGFGLSFFSRHKISIK